MTKRNEVMTNWVAGQYSPHLAGRYDSPLFRYGVEKALNVIFRPQGGFFRAPGSKSIIDLAFGSNRAIGFKVNPSENYQLYFEPTGSIRIYDDTTLKKTITHGIPDGGVGIFNMSYVPIRDVMIFAYQNMAPKVLRAPYTNTYTGNASTTKFALNAAIFASTAVIVKVNGVVKTLTTDYTVAVPTKKGGQYSGATITFLSAPASGAVVEIIRDWEWVDYPAQDGPWEAENLDKKLRILVKDNGGTTYDSTNKIFTGTVAIKGQNKKVSNNAFLDDNWVGRKMRIFQKTGASPDEENWGVVTIDSIVTTGLEYSCSIDADFPLVRSDNTAATPRDAFRSRRWRLSAWYAKNYPQRVGFFEGRVIFLLDNKRWFTVSGDLFTLSPDTVSGLEDNEIYTVTADSGIYFQSGQAQSTAPQWVVSSTVLHVGTDAGHLTISGVGRTAGLSAANIQERKESAVGSSQVIPVVSNSIFFVDNLRQNIYKAKFDWQSDSFLPVKVNNFDDEILRPQVRTIARLTQPFEMIWCVLSDGTIAVCTINEADDIYSWSTLEFPFEAWDIIVAKKDGEREKVYILSKTGKVHRLGYFRTNEEDPYVNVTYLTTQDGGTGYYHSETDTLDDEYQTHSNTTYAGGTPIDLSSLATGERVVDMTTYQNWKKTATSTIVTPVNAYEKGKEFFPEVILRPVVQAQGETNLTAKRKVTNLLFNLWRSTDFLIKLQGETNPTNVNFRRVSDDPFKAPPLFTGIREQKNIAGSKTEVNQVKIYQDLCSPLNVNSMVMEYDEE
jgi:hypothetical protein